MGGAADVANGRCAGVRSVRRLAHRTPLATNSGPMSERMWPGTPRGMDRSDQTSITPAAPSLRATRMARQSWVCAAAPCLRPSRNWCA